MSCHCAPNNDKMIYFVLCDFGKIGREWVARNPANMSRRDTIVDIQSGELPSVVTVLECNPFENICNDVTEDIMRDAFIPEASTVSMQDLTFDHARDHRKHEAV